MPIDTPMVQTNVYGSQSNSRAECASRSNPNNNTVSFLPTDETTSGELSGKPLLGDRKLTSYNVPLKRLNPVAKSTNQILAIDGINIDINKINREYSSYIKLHITSSDIQQILNCKQGTINQSPDYNKAKNLAYICAKMTDNIGANYLLKSILQLGLDVNATHTNKKHTLLQIAAANGNESAVYTLLKNGAQVDQLDSYNNSALYYAIKNSHILIARALLLKAKANTSYIDNEGNNLLHIFVMKLKPDLAKSDKSVEVTKMLLNRGVSVFAKNNNSDSVINCAIEKGCVAILMFILERFKDSLSDTLLHDAVKSSKIAIIRAVAKHQKDCNIKDKYGKTPFHYAVEQGDLLTMQLLAEHHYNISQNNKVDTTFSIRDNDSKTPLMCAIENCKNRNITENDVKIIKTLIKNETNFDCYNENNGKTALHYATELGNLEIVTLLIKYQTIVHIKNNTKITFNNKDYNDKSASDYAKEIGNNEIASAIAKHETTDEDYHQDGKTSLMYVIEKGYLEIITEMLLNNISIIMNCDANGKNALHHAVISGNLEIVNLLIVHISIFHIQNNTRITFANKDHNGKSASDYAKKIGNNEIASAIAKHETVAEDYHKDGKTTLMHVAEQGHFEIVEKMPENINNIINQHDDNGKSAIYYAAEKNNSEMVGWLLERGAKLSDRDKNGETVLEYALNNDYIDATGAIWGYLIVNNYNKRRSKDCNTNNQNSAAILRAAMENNNIQEVVSTLLKYKITFADSHFNEFFYAIEKNISLVNLLILYQVNIDNFYNQSTIFDMINENNETPITYAIKKGYNEIVEALLRYESDITYPDDNDQTPLACAIESNNPTAVSLLLKYGSENNDYSKDDLSTALFCAVTNNNLEIVEMLLENNNTYVNCADKKGKTPLMHAVNSGNLEMVKKLLKYNADIKQCDYSDKTVFDYLFANYNQSIAEILYIHVADENARFQG